MPSRESSLRNLEKARAKWRPPRPWRSSQESQMIRRFVFQWLTGRGKKPSVRAWARGLGVSHTWVQKLVRQLTANPDKMWRLQAERGAPRFADLKRAQECSRQMRERGELRSSRRSRWERLFADRSLAG
jgi:transposase